MHPKRVDHTRAGARRRKGIHPRIAGGAVRRLVVGCAVILAGAAVVGCRAPASASGRPAIRLLSAGAGRDGAVFEVTGLNAAEMRALETTSRDEVSGADVFAVRVEREGTLASGESRGDRFPIPGTFRVDDRRLLFECRFPLDPGVSYRADFRPARLTLHSGKTSQARAFTARFPIPASREHSTTTVTHVYPSASILPENTVKFHLHFSASMAPGLATDHVHLSSSDGAILESPFPEVEPERWEAEGRHFMLLTGGAAFENGKQYTLVIEKGWQDAAGNALRESFEKSFEVGPGDHVGPDPRQWVLETPVGDTREPLEVSFREPLDHWQLGRLLCVEDGHGDVVVGTRVITEQERHWKFVPRNTWRNGSYRLLVDTALMDLAGNRVTTRPALAGDDPAPSVVLEFVVRSDR